VASRADWLLLSGLTVAALFLVWGGSVLWRATERHELCRDACSPYRHTFIEGSCACLDSEGRWVVQEADDP